MARTLELGHRPQAKLEGSPEHCLDLTFMDTLLRCSRRYVHGAYLHPV